jgi:hypothetical protein
VEIELLDADGHPRVPRPVDGRAGRAPGTRRSPTLLAAVAGLAVACVVVIAGTLVAGVVRGRADADLDQRLVTASTAEAAAVGRNGGFDGADPVIALQVLQSPGVVVESTGPPADRVMVEQVPAPATTELSTFVADDALPGRRYRVAATTLPSQPGVAGRTVVAAALPLGSVQAADGPLRAASTALAAVAGLGAALATRRRLRRRRPG